MQSHEWNNALRVDFSQKLLLDTQQAQHVQTLVTRATSSVSDDS